MGGWTVWPVGGGRRWRVDVFLIAASNVGLMEAVAAGRFRMDLLYRLNTVEVTLSPLACRSDFSAVVRPLLTSVAPGWRIAPDALEPLWAGPWPGNIRELRSVLSRLALASATGVIDRHAVAMLPPALPRTANPPASAALGPGSLPPTIPEPIARLHPEN